ncbi:DUF6355 family natural product biosynthesis protein [Streptomyces sp. ODS05-4]|uniref:DUF6355 family natural product biosynthesis protein n=1 Tax=Streptomyces sp. ODS05-4 TaxID=2944939 RepID=UPI00210E564A|nr:DUF6355 family natural product biosynthesis protein [Streptomyces sp. ODS05-4]
MKKADSSGRVGARRGAGRWSVLVGTTLLAVTAASGVAGAAPDTGQVLAKPCGYSESGGRAWYNHCTSDGSRIQIRLDAVAGLDTNRCVDPGETVLGWAFEYRNAYYTGRLCPPR